MSRSVLNRHPRIFAALEECGLPWDIELGSNHYHIRVAGAWWAYSRAAWRGMCLGPLKM
jgi:hypothetical protein